MKKYITLLVLFTSFFNYAQTFVDSGITLPSLAFSTAKLADFDNDGDLDLYLSGMDGNGSVLGGLYEFNAGSYTEVVNSNLPPVVFGDASWGDVDNDGLLDLLVMGSDVFYTDFTAVYKNNGDGTFTDMNLGLEAIEQGSVAFVDYNNDGNLDISYTGIGATLRVTKFYTNNGDNTFTELTGVPVPGLNIGMIRWADYDNDGDADFIISGFDDNAGGTDSFYTELLINNGDETFTVSSEVFHQGWLGEIEWVDYDADNDMDVLLTGVGGAGDQRFSLMYKNNGDGTFTEIDLGFAAVSHSSQEWADYDGDGDLDLFLTGVTTTPGDGNNVSTIYRNDGNDTFTDMGLDSTFTTSYYGQASSGDIDGDGKVDLAITGYSGVYAYSSAVFMNTTGNASLGSSEINNIVVYPNPAKDVVSFSNLDQTIKNISIYNSLGSKVLETKIENNSVDLSTLSKGVYFIKIQNNTINVTKKIFLE